jgi:hypothetical protein
MVGPKKDKYLEAGIINNFVLLPKYHYNIEIKGKNMDMACSIHWRKVNKHLCYEM